MRRVRATRFLCGGRAFFGVAPAYHYVMGNVLVTQHLVLPRFFNGVFWGAMVVYSVGMDDATADAPPPVAARELGRLLAHYRKRAGFSKTGVPGIAETKLTKLENAKLKEVKAKDVWDLCRTYQVPDDEARQLINLADQTGREEWYDKHLTADSQHWLFLQRERRANQLWSHDTSWIPALLQCEAYIDAIYQRAPWPQKGGQPDKARTIRLNWQTDFWHRAATGQTTPEFIIGQAALEINVGKQTTAAQREHMLKLATEQNVRIWVTQYSAGVHPSLGAEYTVLDFAHEDDAPMVWLAAVTNFRNLTRVRDVEFFRFAFDNTRSISIPIQEYLK